MLYITIADDSWTYTPVITRESFNACLVTLITPFLNTPNDIARTTITFPRCVTKQERYCIHKLSLGSDFRTVSYDTQYEDRVIEVTLSKKYVQDLFNGHTFNVAMAEQPEPQKTEKQILLDTLLQFINENLTEEFQEYLRTV
jgi:hypothetical protein